VGKKYQGPEHWGLIEHGKTEANLIKRREGKEEGTVNNKTG